MSHFSTIAMEFESTVTVGNLVSAIIVAFTVLVAAWKISIQIKEMEWKMDMIWKWYAREHNLSDREHRDRQKED